MKYEVNNGWLKITPEVKGRVFEYGKRYIDFLNNAKTERESVNVAVRLLEGAGFKELSSHGSLKAGDKVYRVNRGKGIFAAVIGENLLNDGLAIVGSHIDAPRLDLKQNPLFEDTSLAFLKTHYYGGVKKYQWTAIPLALHGVIVKKDGSTINIAIGDEGSDISFTITDLMPHLAQEQMKKSLADGIEGEALNVLCGSIPTEDKDEKEPVRSALLKILNETYGIVEEDFISAEIEVVPAFKAKDVGFDRSMIAAYGQDDRICSYAALEAILNVKTPKKTAVCLLVDKEEVGSMGITGMQSKFFENTVSELCYLTGKTNDIDVRRCLSKSICLSGDVGGAFDPAYASVSDKRNSALLGHGVVITKYTGSRGKSGSSDANAETVAYIRNIFSKNSVIWQTGELGKVDAGGGGTIAQFMANLDVETLDCGTPILSMHAPYEVASKLDAYMTYYGYLKFMEE